MPALWAPHGGLRPPWPPGPGVIIASSGADTAPSSRHCPMTNLRARRPKPRTRIRRPAPPEARERDRALVAREIALKIDIAPPVHVDRRALGETRGFPRPANQRAPLGRRYSRPVSGPFESSTPHFRSHQPEPPQSPCVAAAEEGVPKAKGGRQSLAKVICPPRDKAPTRPPVLLGPSPPRVGDASMRMHAAPVRTAITVRLSRPADCSPSLVLSSLELRGSGPVRDAGRDERKAPRRRPVDGHRFPVSPTPCLGDRGSNVGGTPDLTAPPPTGGFPPDPTRERFFPPVRQAVALLSPPVTVRTEREVAAVCPSVKRHRAASRPRTSLETTVSNAWRILSREAGARR